MSLIFSIVKIFFYANYKRLFKKVLFLIVVTSVLLSFALLLPTITYYQLAPYRYGNYDYLLKGLYRKGTGNTRKTQAVRPFAAQMDGHPQEKSEGRNISYPHLPYLIAEKSQKDFEKSSVLPPVFDLLVRGCNPIPSVSGYALKTRGRRQPTVFYTTHTQNTI